MRKANCQKSWENKFPWLAFTWHIWHKWHERFTLLRMRETSSNVVTQTTSLTQIYHEKKKKNHHEKKKKRPVVRKTEEEDIRCRRWYKFNQTWLWKITDETPMKERWMERKIRSILRNKFMAGKKWGRCGLDNKSSKGFCLSLRLKHTQTIR